MAFQVDLGSGALLVLDAQTAAGVVAQLRAQGLSSAETSPVAASADNTLYGVFDDEHPIWHGHSGGEGHSSEPEWGLHDEPLAETFYAGVSGKAKTFLDILIARPGQLVSVPEFLELAPNAFSSDYSVAGSINGLRRLKDASGRRYPFYWWKSPTRYAMKPGIASLFRAARTRLSRE